MTEEIFLRDDLSMLNSPGTYYYRLTREMKEFIELCEERTGSKLAAIELNRKDDGKLEYNIGFVME